ncbi:MAG: ABC-F family ATP-binding cassette domain-containing protein [Firmicutes bacterium]|nr:ABC-F family ATP-binding cassette domain-containing protein [Bacillota bacterium]
MLLRLTGAAKDYGARRILAGVSVTVHPGDKIGVVGPNGCGKSTLLKLLAGLEQPDAGSRDTARDVTVGYVGQEAGFQPEELDMTASEYLRQALADVDRWAAEMARLEAAMSDPAVNADAARLEAVMERYARMSARFEQAGGYEAEARMRAAAFGLGFGPEDLARPVKTFSGGQRVRLALARLLLAGPDVLLLDEPTNHLDAAAVEWLEGFLRPLRQAVVVVSHDRYFLDALTGKTWDVEGGRVEQYPGPYTRAMELKAEAWERLRREYDRQQAEIRRLEAFVQRYRAGVKARQARGRAKQLARMERIDPPPARPKSPRIALGAAGPAAREAMRLRDVAKALGGRAVLDGVDLVVERGQRIGVIGPNGSGKTTLLRLMAGQLAPDRGWVIPGEGVKIGYFAQGHEDLDPKATVLEHILAAGRISREEALAHLARFLFTGDGVHVPVGSLSGGERSRVALARLILRRPNVLLLDEPTNHLDVAARTALEAALAEYDGSIVAVSHDRYFLDTICERLWIVGDGRVEVFEGTYTDYARARQEQAQGKSAAGSASPDAAPAERPDRDRGGSPAPAGKGGRGKNGNGRDRRLASRLAAVESEIEMLEAEKRRCEELLADPGLYADGERARTVVQAHREAEARLERLLDEWEQLLAQEAGKP